MELLNHDGNYSSTYSTLLPYTLHSSVYSTTGVTNKHNFGSRRWIRGSHTIVSYLDTFTSFFVFLLRNKQTLGSVGGRGVLFIQYSIFDTCDFPFRDLSTRLRGESNGQWHFLSNGCVKRNATLSLFDNWTLFGTVSSICDTAILSDKADSSFKVGPTRI